MSELKPCPACGSTKPEEAVADMWQVSCTRGGCFMHGPADDRDGAKWNRLPRTYGPGDGARLRKLLAWLDVEGQPHLMRADIITLLQRLLAEPEPEPQATPRARPPAEARAWAVDEKKWPIHGRHALTAAEFILSLDSIAESESATPVIDGIILRQLRQWALTIGAAGASSDQLLSQIDELLENYEPEPAQEPAAVAVPGNIRHWALEAQDCGGDKNYDGVRDVAVADWLLALPAPRDLHVAVPEDVLWWAQACASRKSEPREGFGGQSFLDAAMRVAAWVLSLPSAPPEPNAGEVERLRAENERMRAQEETWLPPALEECKRLKAELEKARDLYRDEEAEHLSAIDRLDKEVTKNENLTAEVEALHARSKAQTETCREALEASDSFEKERDELRNALRTLAREVARNGGEHG